ncbi:MAG: radical SAM family heme chaperone HemW [Bacteroidaceae bacterium]|nr:radical SAM family heme chaperone HemW [Bacteroidaceae bacterium]
MAGIYVHIPFCRSRCAYCDFFSTTREGELPHYVEILCREMKERRDEFADTRVRTIYIGGGTPSLLSATQLQRILDCISANYAVEEEAEVTVEMNPDDRFLPHVNRISLGIQTFDDDLLRLIRRRHDSQTAVCAVKRLQEAGIRNISIDLIYGLPGQTMAQWEHDLDTAFSLGIQHLSAYALSYETGTLLTRWRDEGRVAETDEEISVAMYQRLCQRAREAGFEHYELSNFALPGFHSRHNSSYWTGEPYLGFGPGAHSYDGQRTRRVNEADLDAYFNNPLKGSFERLSTTELYDEAVMCGLRTRRGIDIKQLAVRFGDTQRAYLLHMAEPHLRTGRLVLTDNRLRLTEQAIMISDDIMSDLMA